MKHRLAFCSLPLVALFLALSPAAMASNTWYVDGVHGSDSNNCKSRRHACKTIGHAISLASSGDSVMIADATYQENLAINFSLNLIGSNPNMTIIDGQARRRVVYICKSTVAVVTIARLTIRNGLGGLASVMER
jgi:nitrous oxidase accessory protein NosD